MLIDKLSIPIAADLRPLSGDLDKAADRLDRFAGSAATTVTLAAPSMPGLGTGGLAVEPIDTAELGANMRNAVAQGMEPLKSMGPTFGTEFNQVGGTIITMFRRIDSAMKFPKIDAAMTAVNAKLSRFGLGAVTGFREMRAEAARAKAALDDLPPLLLDVARDEGLIGGRASAVSRAAERLSAPWRDLRAHVAATRAEMERAAMRPPPAGQRPGRGRAFKLPTADVSPLSAGMVRAADVAAAAAAKIAPPFRVAAEVAGSFGHEAINSARAWAQVAATAAAGLGRVVQGVARWRDFTGSLGDVAGKTYSEIVSQHGLVIGSLLKATSLTGGLARGLLKVGTLGVFGRHKREADGLTASMARTSAVSQKLTVSLKGVGRELLAAFGVVGIAFKFAEFFKGGIKGAIDLEETVNKTRETFGAASAEVEANSRKQAKAFGLPKNAVLDAASSIGLIAQGAGMSEKQSAALANSLANLAADASSFYNVPLDTALEKIRAGLVGEAEPLRAFGVLLSENAVKAEAQRLGLVRGGKDLDEFAKTQARASIIARGLSTAQGDLARTADGAANQFRKAGGGLENFAAMVGEMLMPAVKLGVTAFNELLGSVVEVFENNLPMIETWAGYITGAMEGVGLVVRNLGAFWQVASLRVGEFAANTVVYLEALPENFGKITAWLGRNWFNLLTDQLEATGMFWKNLLVNAANFGKAFWEALKGGEFKFDWTPLLEGFHAMTEEFPELAHGPLVDVQKDIDAIYADIGKKEAARTKVAAAPKRMKPGPLENPDKDKDKDKGPQFASLAELGSKEAYSAVVKAQAPGVAPIKDLGKTAKQHLKVAEETRDAVKGQNKGKQAVPVFAFN